MNTNRDKKTGKLLHSPKMTLSDMLQLWGIGVALYEGDVNQAVDHLGHIENKPLPRGYKKIATHTDPAGVYRLAYVSTRSFGVNTREYHVIVQVTGEQGRPFLCRTDACSSRIAKRLFLEMQELCVESSEEISLRCLRYAITESLFHARAEVDWIEAVA